MMTLLKNSARIFGVAENRAKVVALSLRFCEMYETFLHLFGVSVSAAKDERQSVLFGRIVRAKCRLLASVYLTVICQLTRLFRVVGGVYGFYR